MSASLSTSHFEPQIDRILSELKARNDIYLIAVVGIPGSGKSTLSQELQRRLPSSVVLPMDGYHLPQRLLSDEAMKRRGAPYTFDSAKLREDLVSLRNNHTGRFPTFVHAKKDPELDAIHVVSNNSPIIVEGIYLLLKAWDLEALFDFTIFIDCDIDRAMDRVRHRLYHDEIVPTFEEATERVRTNDFVNANLILADGTKERVDLVLWQD